MAEEIRKRLGQRGIKVDAHEASRCYASREFLDPLNVCSRWKAAEKSLMNSTTIKNVRDVMRSKTFEVGFAQNRDQPCLVLHARHQNPTGHDRSACLLSTLWACDSAMGSQEDGTAKLTVGYDFTGAGIRNFSLDQALPFSRLFLYDYPCMVKDIYLINVPWVLRSLMPLFTPLVSRRVNLVSVDSVEEFTKAVGYTPLASSGDSFVAHAESVVPRARSWLGQKNSLVREGSPRKQHQHRSEKIGNISSIEVPFDADFFLNYV